MDLVCSVPAKKLFVVDVPGTVKKLSKVTAGLGGEKRIIDVLEGREQLTLDLSHGSPFGKPLDGTLTTARKVVLKIKKKKHRDGSKEVESVECLGVAETAGLFEHLGDFLVVPPASAAEDAFHLADFITNPEKYNKAPLFFPPNRFIRPQTQVWTFQTVGLTKQHARFRVFDTSIVNKNAPFATSPSVWRFHEPIPSVASGSRNALDGVVHVTSSDKKLLDTVNRLFEEKPMWQRSSLESRVAQVGLQERIAWTVWQLRKVFALTCYCSVDGPWRSALIRLGYDPRKDPNARFSQTIDFRDPHFRTAEFQVSQLAAQASNSVLATAASGQLGHLAESRGRQHSTLLMLDEIDDDGLQRKLRNLPFNEDCSEEGGFWSVEVLNEVRRHLTLKAQRVRLLNRSSAGAISGGSSSATAVAALAAADDV